MKSTGCVDTLTNCTYYILCSYLHCHLHTNDPLKQLQSSCKTYQQPIQGANTMTMPHFVAVVSTVIASAGYMSLCHCLHPDLYHTSRLSGSGWVHELLHGHTDRMHHNLAVSAMVLCRLKKELVEKGGLMGRCWITTMEQLASFLYQIATGNSIQKTAECFQRSNETISSCVLTSECHM